MAPKAVGVVGAVGENGGGPMAFQKRRNGEDVVALTGGDEEADGPTQAVAGHVNLGGQSTSGTPHSRVEAPFFRPLPRPVVACW